LGHSAESRKLIAEVERVAAGAPPVLRVATDGRGSRPGRRRWVVGIVVLALVLDEFIPSGYRSGDHRGGVVLAAVWYRPRMVRDDRRRRTGALRHLEPGAPAGAAPDRPVRLATPPHAGHGGSGVGDEMIALDTFGQRDMLPDGTSGEPVR
jgi:hypothetical protein